jgi:hypothetical protein
MDQGTIKTSKTCYIRNTFEYAIAKTIGDNVISLTEFWENYNIRHAIENIHFAWQQIPANNIRGESGSAFCLIVQIIEISKKKKQILEENLDLMD